MTFDLSKSLARVHIINVKSSKYLSIGGREANWNNNEAELTIRDLDENYAHLKSPQVWNIIQFREKPEKTWILLNQYSMRLACISGRSTLNDARVIQYHTENEDFQQWIFLPQADSNWLIQNKNSGKCIGPHGRSTQEDNYCIQYDNQTGEDPYQLWQFREVEVI
jgi:hypothetical protein